MTHRQSSRLLADRPRVLITGSSGLIGSRLVEDLSREQIVIGLDQAAPTGEIEADFRRCDLTSDASVRETLDAIREAHGDQLASVIHLAAYYDFSGEPSPLYNELTVEGTRRLIRELQKFRVEQFVFASSLLAMRPAEKGELLSESSPTAATWDYPRSKIEAEAVLREEHGAIPIVILRVAGVYDEEGHSVPIGQQIKRIYERQLESYFFPGDAQTGQAFIHLDDLVDCFRMVIEHRGDLGSEELFLIAEPDLMTYAELQDVIGEALHGREWPTIRIPKPVAKAGAWAQEKLAGDKSETFIKPWMVDLADAHYPVDIARARSRLDWEPRHRLRETLPRMLRFLRDEPERWYEVQGYDPPEK